jgi:hypothetical protein
VLYPLALSRKLMRMYHQPGAAPYPVNFGAALHHAGDNARSPLDALARQGADRKLDLAVGELLPPFHDPDAARDGTSLMTCRARARAVSTGLKKISRRWVLAPATRFERLGGNSLVGAADCFVTSGDQGGRRMMFKLLQPLGWAD